MASLNFVAGTLGYDKFKSHRSKRRASKTTSITHSSPEKQSTSHPDPSPPQSPSSSAPPQYTSSPTSSNSSPTSATSSNPPPFRSSSDSSDSNRRRSDGRLDSIGEEMMSSVQGRPRRTSSVYSRESVSDIRRMILMEEEEERFPEEAPPEYESVVHGEGNRKGDRGRRVSGWWGLGRWGRHTEEEEGGLRRVGEVDFDMRV